MDIGFQGSDLKMLVLIGLQAGYRAGKYGKRNWQNLRLFTY